MEISRKWVWAFVGLNWAIFTYFSVQSGGLGMGLGAHPNPHVMLEGATVASRPWTLLTYGFMHGSLVHLFINMWSLTSLMKLARGKGVGRGLLWAYGWAMLMGGIFVALIPHSSHLPTVGASGAIFGLFGFIMVHHKFQHLRTAFLVMLAFNAALPLLIPLISWQCHLGGLLAGLAVGFVSNYRTYVKNWLPLRAFLLNPSAVEELRATPAECKAFAQAMRRQYMKNFDTGSVDLKIAFHAFAERVNATMGFEAITLTATNSADMPPSQGNRVGEQS